jgi:hypothetical protein
MATTYFLPEGAPSAGFAGAIPGGGSDEPAVRPVRSVGRGAQPLSELLLGGGSDESAVRPVRSVGRGA